MSEIETFEKTETESYTLKFDFEPRLEFVWSRGTVYALGNYVRPTSSNGFEYECTTAGQTGTRQPKWSLVAGNLVPDGSIVWTVRAFGTNGRDTISGVNVDSPAGITVAAPVTNGAIISIVVSGGVRGATYIISVEITTTGGDIIEMKLAVFIDGD